MPGKAEIYFYCDPTFDGDLETVLGTLEEAGHRVVVGKDPEELKLLVQLERPTAIIFTFISEGSSLSSAFKLVSRTALNHNVPILVVGPAEPREGLVMYVPEGSQFKRRAVPFDMLVTAVEQLRDNPLPNRVTDTEISVEGIFDAEWDAETAESVEDSQPFAVIVGSGDSKRGEISGPIALPLADEKQEAKNTGTRKRSRVLSLLFVGAALCLAAALVLASRPTTPPPRESRLSNFKQAGGIMVASDNQGRFVTELKLDQGEPAAAGHGGSSEADAGEPDQSELPFPGYFKPGAAVFWFPDQWEEERFVQMLRTSPEASAIRIVGHSTREEVESQKDSMGQSRAWSVFYYLSRQGIDKARMSVVKGQTVSGTEDLDKNGRPRNRWVSVIISGELK